VVFHAYDSPIAAPEQRNAWSSMVLTLKGYAQKHGYTLAAAYGDSPRDTHYYYVRTDFPDGAEILRKIRNLDYFWYENGRKSTNYALLRPS
ncbi:MAG: hypothetical protein HY331_08370, partial [Chloroflexi bacterium]|nr:hypothetical protein [Chloroflexota bacterium]